MKRRIEALLTGAVLLAAGHSAAWADTIFEVERARAAARAGGPVNAHDAELLDRWGATSGTPDWHQAAPTRPAKPPQMRTKKKLGRTRPGSSP